MRQDGVPTKLIDKQEIQQVLVDQRSFMLRVAMNLCQEGSTAEDAVQEASLRALQRPPRYSGSLRGWLRRAVTNTSIELLRAESLRKYREKRAARPERIGVRNHRQDPLCAEILESLEGLRDPYRTALKLSLVEGLSYKAIATRTGSNLETVRSQLKRGRAMLREDLDRRMGTREKWFPSLLLLCHPLEAEDREAVRHRMPLSPSRRGLLAAGVASALALVLVASSGRSVAVDEVPMSTSQLSDARFESNVAASSTEAMGERQKLPLDATGSAYLTGRCLDETGRAVPGAETFLLPASSEALLPLERNALERCIADAEGRFKLPMVSEPAYLLARSSGPRLTREVARLLPDDPPGFEILLRLEPAAVVRGVAVDRHGEAVPLAEIELFLPSNHPLVEARPAGSKLLYQADLPIRAIAGQDGSFEITQPLSDRRRLWAHRSGFPDGSAAAIPGQLAVVRMAPCHTQEVRAMTPRGDPLPGVKVELFALGVADPWVGMTDESGECFFDNLPGAKYFVARLSRADLTTRLTLPAGWSAGGVPVRQRRFSSGQVVDRAGARVEGVTLRGFHIEVAHTMTATGFSPETARRMAELWRATSDAGGRFRFPPYAFPQHIQAEHPDWPMATTTRLLPRQEEVKIHAPENPVAVRVDGHVESNGSRSLTEFRVRAIRMESLHPRPGSWRKFAAHGERCRWEEPGPIPDLFEIDSPGFARAFVQPEPSPEGCRFEARLTPSRDVELRFVDVRGAPLQDMQVVLTTREGEPIFIPYGDDRYQSRIRLDADGSARLPDAPLGEWVCTLNSALFFEPLRAQFTLEEDSPAVVEVPIDANLGGDRCLQRIEFKRPGMRPMFIRLHVKDRDGKDLRNDRFIWKADGFRPDSRRKLGMLLRGGEPAKGILDFAAARAPAPTHHGRLRARHTFVEMLVPFGEPFSVEIRTSTGLQIDHQIQAAPVDPIVVRLSTNPVESE